MKRGYLDADPLKNVSAWDKTPRTRWRPLAVAEIQKLLNTCRPHFRPLYEVAVLSGLRRNELMSLKVADLNVEMGGPNLHAEWTKDRKPGFQPLPPDVVKRLAEAAQGKAQTDPLLRVPVKTCLPFREDLKTAEIEKSGPGGAVDFHNLRTTYVNLVLESGAGLKETMDLVRHSTADLTLNVYGRSRWERRAELVGSIGAEVLSGLENVPDTITGPERKVAGLESPSYPMSYMAGQ